MILARFAYRGAPSFSALLIASSALRGTAQNQQAAAQDPLRRAIVYHLPDLDRAIARATPGGLLALNIAYTSGTFTRTERLA